MTDKEKYRLNRDAGVRGQGRPVKGEIVGYTAAADVVQGAYGSRKARRAVEAHTTGRARRKALQA